MANTNSFLGEVATELLKLLFQISSQTVRYKNTADNIIELIQNIHPMIVEIDFSDVKLPAHRQAQIRMLSEILEKGKKLMEKVLKCNRWNVVREVYLFKKMERLEKQVTAYFRGPVLTNIIADVHFLQANYKILLDQVDNFDKLSEEVGSMTIKGGRMIANDMEIETKER